MDFVAFLVGRFLLSWMGGRLRWGGARMLLLGHDHNNVLKIERRIVIIDLLVTFWLILIERNVCFTIGGGEFSGVSSFGGISLTLFFWRGILKGLRFSVGSLSSGRISGVASMMVRDWAGTIWVGSKS